MTEPVLTPNIDELGSITPAFPEVARAKTGTMTWDLAASECASKVITKGESCPSHNSASR